MDLWGEHTELVINRERKVEVIVVEVDFSQGLNVNLRAVRLGGCSIGLGSDRLDHPVVGSGAIERHGDEVEGDPGEQRRGPKSTSANSMVRQMRLLRANILTDKMLENIISDGVVLRCTSLP